jgi:hypothetical protein
MKTVFFTILALLITLPAEAAWLFSDTSLYHIRIVSVFPDQEIAVIRNLRTGQDVQVTAGDFLGLEQALVVRIKEKKVQLKMDDRQSTSLAPLPFVRPSPQGHGAEFGN